MPDTRDIGQAILDFLNFSESASFEDIRSFLQGTGLCRRELILEEDAGRFYSLFSKDEVLERKARGLPLSVALERAAAQKADESVPPLCDYRASVVFPRLGPDGDDGAPLRRAFHSVVRWFRVFMLGCAAGVMDVDTLNAYASTRRLVLEFRSGKNSMNPVLSPTAMREDVVDGPIEREILARWIYPFIFTGNGHMVSLVRRCRQCGLFFKGKRLHASFCTAKCRMAWNYANRA